MAAVVGITRYSSVWPMTVGRAHYGRRSRSVTRPARTTLYFLYGAGGDVLPGAELSRAGNDRDVQSGRTRTSLGEGFGLDGRISDLILRRRRGRCQDLRRNLTFPIVLPFIRNRPESLTGRGFAVPLVSTMTLSCMCSACRVLFHSTRGARSPAPRRQLSE